MGPCVAKAVRSKLVQLKRADPHMKFRLEINNVSKETVQTSERIESGLEKPESFFVELNSYQEEYGEADANSIVFEQIDGVMTAGVASILDSICYC